MTDMPDLRPQLAAAQQWVCDLVAGVRPDQLRLPTPCDEFDVAALLEHLFGVELRTRRYATHRDVGDVPATVPLTSTDPAAVAAELRALSDEGATAWAAWDAGDLGSLTISGPFGTVPGGAAVGIMAAENLAHGWDLAVATGQPTEADPAVAEPLLAVMQRALPPAGARDGVPFGDPVESSPEAGPTERLANWTGRTRG